MLKKIQIFQSKVPKKREKIVMSSAAITVKEIKDNDLIEEITVNTLKKREWIDPRKIPLEVEQYKTIPFFAVMYDNIYVGYAILLIHNEYVAELQCTWDLNYPGFTDYNEYMSKVKDVEKTIDGVCKDYCNSRGMSLLYCNVEEKFSVKRNLKNKTGA